MTIRLGNLKDILRQLLRVAMMAGYVVIKNMTLNPKFGPLNDGL